MTKDLEIHIIELPKALKEYEKEPQNVVMQWMKFLDNPNDMEVRKIMEENKDIKKAIEEIINKMKKVGITDEQIQEILKDKEENE